MQQYLPFTVLKLVLDLDDVLSPSSVATVLTVYGIETHRQSHLNIFQPIHVATVLTVYGIETQKKRQSI